MNIQNLFKQVIFPNSSHDSANLDNTQRQTVSSLSTQKQTVSSLQNTLPSYALSTQANYESRHQRFTSWAESSPNSLPAERCRALLLHFLSLALSEDNGRGVLEECDILDAGCGPGRDLMAFHRSSLGVSLNSAESAHQPSALKSTNQGRGQRQSFAALKSTNTGPRQCWNPGCNVCKHSNSNSVRAIKVNASGFDICKGFVTECKNKGLNVVQSDFTSYFSKHCVSKDGVASRKFHGIFALASLFHLPKTELCKVLEGFYLHLHSRGLLLTTIPTGKVDALGGDGRHMLHLQYEEQVSLLRNAGLTPVHSEDVAIYSGKKWVLIVSQKRE